jgi:uncharacterized damage-inducible protein DinB
MYQTIAAFLEDWALERAATLKVMKALTDSSLGQRVSTEGRTLGFLAWHIVLSLSEMSNKAGLRVEGPAEDAAPPSSASAVAAAYERSSASVAEQVGASWKDSMLADELVLYGRPWKRRGVLASLVKHQVHHRGQMTVLMRQAGLAVPGVYGPAREEWTRMGMPPQS